MRKLFLVVRLLFAALALVGALWFTSTAIGVFVQTVFAQSVDSDGYPSGMFESTSDGWYSDQNCCGQNDTHPQGEPSNYGGGAELYNY